jgi:hypothetical protein
VGPRGGERPGWGANCSSGTEPKRAGRATRSRHRARGAASGRGPRAGRPSACPVHQNGGSRARFTVLVELLKGAPPNWVWSCENYTQLPLVTQDTGSFLFFFLHCVFFLRHVFFVFFLRHNSQPWPCLSPPLRVPTPVNFSPPPPWPRSSRGRRRLGPDSVRTCELWPPWPCAGALGCKRPTSIAPPRPRPSRRMKKTKETIV